MRIMKVGSRGKNMIEHDRKVGFLPLFGLPLEDAFPNKLQ